MTEDLKLDISLFVEHGREAAAAGFYCGAFGARPGEQHRLADGTLAGVEIRLGGMRLFVCGSNPNREAEPARGGPFYPKAAGAVSAMFQLTVPDLDAVLAGALERGAKLRDPAQTDTLGRRVASLFDPYGHIWALIERRADMRSAA